MNLGQILALGVGAWFLYQYVYGSATENGSDQTAGNEGSTGGNGSAPTIAKQIQDAAAGDAKITADGKLGFWEWNYYYNKVTGKTGPDPIPLLLGQAGFYTVADIQNHPISFAEWSNYMPTESGLKGIYSLDWYGMRNRGTGIGTQNATGFERANKRFIQ